MKYRITIEQVGGLIQKWKSAADAAEVIGDADTKNYYLNRCNKKLSGLERIKNALQTPGVLKEQAEPNYSTDYFG